MIVLSDKDRPLSRSFFKSIVGDWGSEKGRGFYEKSDTLGRTIQQFLMFGVNDGVNAVGDIPDGGVQGLCVGNQERKAKVGVTTIEEKIKLGDLR